MDQWLTKFINSDSELLASILQPKASLWPSGNYPHLNLRIGSSNDDLKRQFGTFSYVMSLEVIAHVHDPRSFSRSICELLTDDGYAMISIPYHGYFKNLTIAAVGGFDNHVRSIFGSSASGSFFSRLLSMAD